MHSVLGLLSIDFRNCISVTKLNGGHTNQRQQNKNGNMLMSARTHIILVDIAEGGLFMFIVEALRG